MYKFVLFSFFTVLFCSKSISQSRYIVRLKDKAGTPHSFANPNTYLSTKSIARRTKYNIAIDSTDLPITPRYLDSIRLTPGVTILNFSKWLNQVAIQTTNPAAITKINSFPFVITTNPIAPRLANDIVSALPSKKLAFEPTSPLENARSNDNARTNLSYGNSFNQINMHNGQFLHDQGFLGQNMTIAVMDGGFNSYLTNAGIDSLRINNQIKETWDYVANEASVNEDDAHGFYCLSIIGANKTGQMIGSAPKANFYLYRTEDVFSEYPIEEQNWIAAAERADSIGIDVFSTSLGYLDFDNPIYDYSYAQRNGNTAMITRASDLAAKKGILVCNSAGNNGNGSPSFVDYKYVAVPADGDSVFAVGSCNANGNIASSSAWGPTSSGKIKPNVTSLGQGASFINLGGSPTNGNGTSFSNPNIAGLVTDLWQAFPELNNMSIIDVTQQASHLFSAPDGRFGYGIPNMKRAFVLALRRTYTRTPTINNCNVDINFNAKDNGSSTYQLERKLPGVVNFAQVKNLNASNGAFALKTYNFKDTLPAANLGIVTYRIKHTMGTDTSFYYDEFTVNYTNACLATAVPSINTYNIKIAPNPIQSTFNINFGSLNSNKSSIIITDAKGSIVYTQKLIGESNVTINSDYWLSGIYNIKIVQNNKTIYLKNLIKE